MRVLQYPPMPYGTRLLLCVEILKTSVSVPVLSIHCPTAKHEQQLRGNIYLRGWHIMECGWSSGQGGGALSVLHGHSLIGRPRVVGSRFHIDRRATYFDFPEASKTARRTGAPSAPYVVAACLQPTSLKPAGLESYQSNF